MSPQPYRERAEMPLAIVEPAPRGLVRANGATCKCTPPSLFFRWRFSVRPGDEWFCGHGFGWRWQAQPGHSTMFCEWGLMPAVPSSSADRGGK